MMTPDSIYLAIAPNILRKTVQDISRLGLSMDLIPPQTHEEMLDFSCNFGTSRGIPGLTLCAYPQFIRNVLHPNNACHLLPLPSSLPPMRSELTALGMAEPSRFFRVVGFVPFIIASAKDVSPALTDWDDLCRSDICEHVAVPPLDTPLPELFDTMMTGKFGSKAAEVIMKKDTNFAPLDINKNIDAGVFKAGLSIPAFSRTFRNGNGYLVWPKSGAWPVPLMATIHKDAPSEALDFLNYLLSNDYQNYLSESGGIIPVTENISWFEEMAENNGTLDWPGWQTFVAMGTPKAA